MYTRMFIDSQVIKFTNSVDILNSNHIAEDDKLTESLSLSVLELYIKWHCYRLFYITNGI